jgi:DNA-directed RNA polymerase sigma subunit (sigma70/sigma32)
MGIADNGWHLRGEGLRLGREPGGGADRTAFLDALRRLDEALDENIERAQRMKRRIAELERACTTGRPISETLPAHETQSIPQMLSKSGEALQEHGTRLRRTKARVLHHEGMTMEGIARLFGVTRQRVSVLLRGD